MIKMLLVSFIFVINLYSSEVYMLPYDSKEAKSKISELIMDAKEEIFISMYNFSYKKFAKELIKASEKGIKVTVLFDEEKIAKDSEVYDLLKDNNIKTIINNDKNKMHLKIALIDSKKAIIGSTNWTKKSFEKNYDLVYITEDEKVIKKLIFLQKSFN